MVQRRWVCFIDGDTTDGRKAGSIEIVYVHSTFRSQPAQLAAPFLSGRRLFFCLLSGLRCLSLSHVTSSRERTLRLETSPSMQDPGGNRIDAYLSPRWGTTRVIRCVRHAYLGASPTHTKQAAVSWLHAHSLTLQFIHAAAVSISFSCLQTAVIPQSKRGCTTAVQAGEAALDVLVFCVINPDRRGGIHPHPCRLLRSVECCRG